MTCERGNPWLIPSFRNRSRRAAAPKKSFYPIHDHRESITIRLWYLRNRRVDSTILFDRSFFRHFSKTQSQTCLKWHVGWMAGDAMKNLHALQNKTRKMCEGAFWLPAGMPCVWKAKAKHTQLTHTTRSEQEATLNSRRPFIISLPPP